MSERRFFTEKSNIIGGHVFLMGDEHRHLSIVLRLRQGDNVVVCDGTGKEYNAVVSKIEKSRTLLDIVSEEYTNSEPRLNVTLYQGLVKGEKMDFIIQKATELGVTKIVPFTSKYTVAENSLSKNDRFYKIALSAAKQSRRAIIPEISEVQNFDDLLKFVKNNKNVILAYENENANTLKQALTNIKSKVVTLIVGSEGGFSTEEVEELMSVGAVSVKLGKRILRAETAAISILACTMFDLNEWE
ncbi:MAG: 16S rRNA (uracil(1498)-N(3))-methyltransferase [Clostridia bacterium]|jgi:16S rRNA (uracil1498-N3)-methyltransferase|nr:16S rRNA (uracil(1498)-N(3))-methyltransferase [Clostridia bacterium]